jgi:DNA-binding NtrC family response regulator
MSASQPLVVCVDDDPDVSRLIASSLRREKMNMMSTTEPDEALEWVLDNDVAVLVCDYEMPLMNGIELAAKVRQLRPTTVRILLTGHVTAHTAMNGINKGGVFRFIPKPFEPELLIGVVHEGVSHHLELAAVANERDHVVRRGRATAEMEMRYPTLTTPMRAIDGAYVVGRTPNDTLVELGLEALLELRRRR